MPTIKLLDSAIQRLPAPEKGTVWYYDRDLAGFQLAVGRRARTFYLVKSLAGRNVRKRLGEWPAVPTAAARKLALVTSAQVSQGSDPRHRRDGTLAEWLADYIEVYSHRSHDRLSTKTAQQYRDYMNRYCKAWLRRDLRQITNEDLLALHRKMRDIPATANGMLRILRAIMRHAGITPAAKFPWYAMRRRENGVKPNDRTAFGDAIRAIENPSKRAAWLLGCYTGIRRSNLLALRRDDVDLDAATLFLGKMKNKHARTMPLCPQAVEVLRAVAGLHAVWVLPSFDGSRHGHLVEVRDKAMPEHWTFHDTRRTFTECGAEALLPEYAIQYLRGDVVNQSMSQRYMSHLDLREPIKLVGDRVEAALATKPRNQNVVAIRQDEGASYLDLVAA